MIPYIFHVSLLLALCYLLYRLLWEKETYFQLNRWILITCLLLSFGLPLLTVPENWSLQKRVVQQEILGGENEGKPFVNTTKVVENPIAVLEGEERNQETFTEAEKETASEKIVGRKKIDKEKVTNNQLFAWAYKLSFWQIVQYIYLGGLIIFSLNFLIQLMLIIFQKQTNPTIQDGQFTIVEINQDKAPFSFGNNIFINPTKYDWETYNQILAHEKIHSEQRHTLDILLAELAVIVQWFNPFAWFYRKAVENNLEYLTDYNMLNKGTERESYQMNLLRVSVPQLPLNLTTNYNQSFLKKRIAMMNVKKSSASSSWKYLLLFPLLALTVITLNPIHLQSQTTKPVSEKDKKEQAKAKKSFWERWSTPPAPPVAPPAPPMPPAPPAFGLQSAPVAPLAPPAPPAPPMPSFGDKIRTTTTTTITTTTGDWNDKEEEGMYVIGETYMEDGGSKGIYIEGAASFDETDIVVHKGMVSIDGVAYGFATSGDWMGKFNGSQLCLQLASGDKVRDYSFSISFCDRDFGSSVYPSAKGPFKLARAAGVLTLDGNFNGKTGKGDYDFAENTKFRNYLNGAGYTYITENLMLHLYISEIGKDFFTFLKKEGYNNLKKEELEKLVYHRVRKERLEAYVESFRKAGLGKPEMSDIVGMTIHDIPPDYIEEIGGALFKELTIDDIVQASIHGIEPAYIRDIHSLGYKDIAFKDIIEFSGHGIDVDYINDLKNSGLALSKHQIIQAGAHGVDADFVKRLSEVGYNNLQFNDIIEFGVHGVDADFIEELHYAGIQNLTKQQILEAAIHGTDASDIIEFMKLDIKGLSFNNITQLKVHGIDADFVEEFIDLGYDDLSVNQITDLRIHGIDADDVYDFNKLGFKDISVNQLKELRIHGVTPAYIKRINRNGEYDTYSLKDFIELKIHGPNKRNRRQE